MVGVIVDRRRACAARAGAGGAIVLAGERDAVALVGARLIGAGPALAAEASASATASEPASVAAVKAVLAFMGDVLVEKKRVFFERRLSWRPPAELSALHRVFRDGAAEVTGRGITKP